ncbi:MAG: ImmA/IrrE family metallo-endopeptidase [Acidobacteria bacterium]|nr:MAG: ImmA/IrrE family metallo-endopeptidase [Acidobacteriota bacterium]
MAKPASIPGLNPEILAWARRRAGHDVATVAKRLRKSPEDVRAWEAGDASPTYVQLEKLAYEIYKRPLALFFFPEPPEEEDPEHRFRTLPAFELARLAPDTRLKIRDACAKQIALHELTGGRNPAERLVFRDLASTPDSDPAGVAEKLRDYLGVSVEEQRSWRSAAAALARWRESIEEHGVFVFKSSFKQQEISGFCLYGEEFPIIYLNNSVAKTRQIFTLFHELAHLLLRLDGITKRDDSYIGHLRGEEREVEVFCNAFAGAFLVPQGVVRELAGRGAPADDEIKTFATQLKVSREVILRRLLDRGVVSRQHYEQKAAEWTDDYFERRRKSGGGNYYNTQGVYLGKRFLALGFQQLYRGVISRAELADVLGVKATSLDGLEQRMLAGTG